MQLGKVTLYVEDQDKSVDFWTTKMGFEIKLKQPMGPDMFWIEVGPKGKDVTSLVIYSKEAMNAQNPDTNTGCPSLLFTTTDLNSEYQKLKDNDVDIDEINVMPYGKMTQFRDIDNNSYVLRED